MAISNGGLLLCYKPFFLFFWVIDNVPAMPDHFFREFAFFPEILGLLFCSKLENFSRTNFQSFFSRVSKVS